MESNGWVMFNGDMTNDPCIMFIAQKTQVDGRDIVDTMSMVNVFFGCLWSILLDMTYTCGTGREFDDYPSTNVAAVHIQEVFRPVQ